MNIFDALTKRRSIRRFTQQPVKRDDIFILCEMGLQAPTAGDRQDIKFIVSYDRRLIRALPSVCSDQIWIAGAQAIIAVCSQPQSQEEFFPGHGSILSRQASGAATQNILLTAHALGYGACWIGGFDQEKVDDLFGTRGSARVESIVALGVANESPNVKKRNDVTSAVFFDQYGNDRPDLELLNKDYALKFERALEEAEYKLKGWENEQVPWITKLKKSMLALIDKLNNKKKEGDSPIVEQQSEEDDTPSSEDSSTSEKSEPTQPEKKQITDSEMVAMNEQNK